MTKHRRRFKESSSLDDRLADAARDLRDTADHLPSSMRRDDLLRRADQHESARKLNRWLNSSELHAPTE